MSIACRCPWRRRATSFFSPPPGPDGAGWMTPPSSRATSRQATSKGRHRRSRLAPMRRQRFTKIVATLGPASSTPERLRALFEAGADVFRLNFSHGAPEDHRQRVEQLRAMEKKYNHPIAILMDLQGPKLRLGSSEGRPGG